MSLTVKPSRDGGDEESEIVAEINITPLTDIFLVLLIIFMVTSSVMSNSGVEVNLPKAGEGTSTGQPEGVIISLLPGGQVKINSQAITPGNWGELTAKVKLAFTQTKSRLVILEGDRQAFLGSAIEVMDAARKAGAEKFAIATSPEGK
jgi:biopolymer transport protein ExbD